MTKIAENAAGVQPPAGAPRPLANARQRRRSALRREISSRIPHFLETAADSDLEFAEDLLLTWEGQFQGDACGLASACETLLRGEVVHVHVEESGVCERCEPDQPATAAAPVAVGGVEPDVEHLVAEAMSKRQPVKASEQDAAWEFREDFMSLAADFFAHGARGDQTFLLQLLRAWDEDKARRSLAGLAFGQVLRGDLNALQEPDPADLAVAGAILDSGEWQAEFLRDLAIHWRLGHRLTPADMLRLLADKQDDFMGDIRVARKVLELYPSLLTLSEAK